MRYVIRRPLNAMGIYPSVRTTAQAILVVCLFCTVKSSGPVTAEAEAEGSICRLLLASGENE